MWQVQIATVCHAPQHYAGNRNTNTRRYPRSRRRQRSRRWGRCPCRMKHTPGASAGTPHEREQSPQQPCTAIVKTHLGCGCYASGWMRVHGWMLVWMRVYVHVDVQIVMHMYMYMYMYMYMDMDMDMDMDMCRRTSPSPPASEGS